MRATIDLPDSVYNALRTRAEHQGTSIQAVIVEAIEKEIGLSPTPGKMGNRVTLPLIRSARPGALRSLTSAQVDDILD